MALANVNVTLTEPNVSVSSDNVNVSVASTTSTITVSNINVTSNTDIRNAITFTNVNSSGGLNYSQANGDITYNLYGDNGIDIGANGLVSVKFAINDNYLEIAGLNNGLRTKASSLFPVEELVVADANGTTSFSNVIVGNGNAGGSTGTLQANSNNFMFKHGTGTGHLDGNFHMATNDLPVSNVGHGVNYSVSNANVSFRHSNLVFTPGPNGEIGYIGGAQMSNVPGDVSSAPHITGNTITVQNDGKIQFAGLSTAEIYKSDSTSLTMRNLSGNLILHTDLFTNSNVMLGTPATPANVRVATNSVGGVPQGPAGNLHVDNSVIAGYYHGDGSNITGVSSLTNAQVVAHIATVPLTVGGNLQVNGNIDATGNINYQNVTDLYVTDQKITLNANATTDATVEIISFRPQAGADTKLRWNETTDIWEFTNDGSTFYPIPTSTTDLAEGTNLYYTDSRFDTRLGTKTTDNLTEGSTNQYYTDARSRAAVSVTSNTPSGNGSLSYDNGTGVFTFTPADASGGISNADAQAFIQTNGLAMTANITSNSLIQTTGNLQVNADVDVSGLSGLTFDSATNNLGLGTPTPKAALHIRGTSNESQLFMTEFNGGSGAGIDFRTYRAAGTESTPDFVTNNKRLWTRWHHAYSETGSSDDGIDDGGFDIAFGEQVLTDATHSAGSIPTYWQIYNYRDGDTSNNPTALIKARANGSIEFAMPVGSAFDQDALPAVVIDKDGIYTSNANITTSANVSGNYILGNGSQLTGIVAGGSTDSFGTVTVAGQTNIQASQANAILDIASTGDITLTTSGNTLTIGGSGGAYGNTQVQNFLQSGTLEAPLKIKETDGSNLVQLDAFSDTPTFSVSENKRKARGTDSSPTTLVDGDSVARGRYLGYDGDSYETGFYSNVYVDGTVSDGTVPMGMSFISNSSSTATPFLNIRANGDVEMTEGLIKGDLDGAVVIDVNNNTGATLNKGEAVYLTGGNSGDSPNVALADSDDVTKMPAIGIVKENISNGAIGQVVTSGVMNNSAHGYTLGADLYISDVAGGLTTAIPTGESKGIQKIGKVVSANHIIVQGAFRTNATPNLNDGNFFLGNASNQSATAVFTDEANTAIAANLAALTGDLTFTGATPVLTMGETGKFRIGNISNSNNPILSFLPGNMHKYSLTDASADTFGVLYHEGVEHYKDDDDGIKFVYAKGRGSIGTPAGPQDGDRVLDEYFMHYSDSKFKDRSNFGQAGRFVFYDAGVATYDDNTMPLTQEFFAFNDGDLTTGVPRSLLRLSANGTISFNGDATREDFTSAPVTITKDGNVTSNASIIGAYLHGDGSNISGISSDSFGTFTVSGQTNIQASQGNAQVDFAAGTGMTITTSGNTMTFASTGGYGNAEVQTYLASGNNAANIETKGNVIVAKHTGTVTSAIGSYFGSNNTGSNDQIIPSTDPQWSDATAITMSGTTNGDLTFLNGNTYYTKSVSGGTYEIYTDAGLSSPVQSGLDSEAPSGLIASYPGDVNSRLDVAGDVFTTGSLELSSANVLTTITQYQGNTTTGTGDIITIGSDVGWYNGQYVTFQGATDASLTFLNGNTYQVATGGGSGTTWNLYTNYQNFTKLVTEIGTFNNPSGPTLVNHRTPNDTSATIYGDLIVNANSVLKVNAIESFFPNQVITLTGLRVNDFKGNDPINPPTYTNTQLATLQEPFTGGYIFVTGDRAVDGEGVPAYWSGSQWKYFSDNANVSYT